MNNQLANTELNNVIERITSKEKLHGIKQVTVKTEKLTDAQLQIQIKELVAKVEKETGRRVEQIITDKCGNLVDYTLAQERQIAVKLPASTTANDMEEISRLSLSDILKRFPDDVKGVIPAVKEKNNNQ